MKDTDPQTKRDSYHHGDLRAQLIEATRQLVETKGPDRFSVAEACRLAGVSTAAPYKHFKDKEEMLRAVALGGMTRQRDAMVQAAASQSPGSRELLVAIGQAYLAFARSEPAVFRLMFGLSERHDSDDELVEMGRLTYGGVTLAVAMCRGQTTVGPQDEQLAFALWSFVHGLSFLNIDGKLSKLDVDVSMEATMRLIVDRVMGPEMPEQPAPETG